MGEPDVAVQIADILLRVDAVALSPNKPFVYTSGIKSPIYTDNRLLISYPAERSTITRLFCDRILAETANEPVDLIAATATAGIPFGAWIADRLDKSMVYVRGEDKAHGKMQRIEGLARPHQVAIVIEDLITTAQSAIANAETLRGNDITVQHVFSIFTYEFLESARKLAEARLVLHPLCGFSTLIQRALAIGKISEPEFKLLLEWKQSRDAEFTARAADN